MLSTDSMTFENQCRSAVLGLRGSLLELYAAAGAAPDRPQDVARQFSLNKNLTWKISRIFQTDEAFEAASLLPGRSGVEILLAAMSKGGGVDEQIDKVRAAAQAIEEMIAEHAGDRPTFDLLLDGMTSQEPLRKSRELAFRGNSGTWGIQAQTRVTAQFLAPSTSQPDTLDITLVGGVVGGRRLRPLTSWPLLHVASYQDYGSRREDGRLREPLTEHRSDHGDADTWLLREFCAGALPDITVREHGNGSIYEIGDGPVGRQGDFTCLFGYCERSAVPRYRDDENRFGELFSTVSLPAETLLFDTFVHRDLTEALSPVAELYGNLRVGPTAFDRSYRLPCEANLSKLGLGGKVSTPRVPNYEALIRRVTEACGWDARDFHCIRWVLNHPPMPSTAILRYPLIDPPVGVSG